MSAKKKAKKRLPKPVPCECWCAIGWDGVIYPDWCTNDLDRVAGWKAENARVIRVRITPVAKRRKGAPR